MYREAFDKLFERGRDAVLSGSHYRDTPPVAGGRWGVSVILHPGAGCKRRLRDITLEAIAVAGRGHWPTGSEPAVHLTVRALEPHRTAVADDDPVIARYAAALRRAADDSRPARLRFRGLTLTPSGVMACAYPVGPEVDGFAGRLAAALAGDGWFEASFVRDIWYATVVHFTGPLADPAGLVEWVAARRDLDLGDTGPCQAELVRWRYNGRQPMRVRLATAVPGLQREDPAQHRVDTCEVHVVHGGDAPNQALG